jgi:hypothetical protein
MRSNRFRVGTKQQARDGEEKQAFEKEWGAWTLRIENPSAYRAYEGSAAPALTGASDTRIWLELSELR